MRFGETSLSTLTNTLLGLALVFTVAACSSPEPLKTVAHVDLQRFMGKWYVIANIPTAIEKGAHNAVESYRLDDDGSIETTFTFRDESFDGELKTYHPRGFVSAGSNAVWGMQFVWPIKADYRIIYLDDDYKVTVIGRNKRDYVWIMARKPEIPDSEYAKILDMLGSVGYDTTQVQRVPQKW
jgi:apolipoprotein D and lipocalin family protein